MWFGDIQCSVQEADGGVWCVWELCQDADSPAEHLIQQPQQWGPHTTRRPVKHKALWMRSFVSLHHNYTSVEWLLIWKIKCKLAFDWSAGSTGHSSRLYPWCPFKSLFDWLEELHAVRCRTLVVMVMKENVSVLRSHEAFARCLIVCLMGEEKGCTSCA